MRFFDTFFIVAFFVYTSYFFLLMFYYSFLGFVAFLEGRKRASQAHTEDYSAISMSTFTIPVSVIIPAHNEEAWILNSVKSVLRQDYPEFEVILVDDGSTDRTYEILREAFRCRSMDNPYIDHFHSGKIYSIVKSEDYPNITVLSKIPEYKPQPEFTILSKFSGYKKAGAVNAGLNLARYKYICIIDADTVLEPDALKKVMAHIQKDPEKIIGAGSYYGLANGFNIKDGIIIKRNFFYNPIIAYQNLEYIRSFIINRVAWSRFNATPIVSGGFAIWRRDILTRLGGYSPAFSSEDMEFTFRAQDYVIKNRKKNFKIIMLPYYVGWTAGPDSVGSLIKQRDRWQRVKDESLSLYRYMIFNPRYRGFGLFTLPYFLLYEVLGVFFETSSIALVILGWFLGILDVRVLFIFILLMILSQTCISLFSIFVLVRNNKLFKIRDILYFVILSFLEFFWYKWILTIAKLTGTYHYLRGIRTFDQYRKK